MSQSPSKRDVALFVDILAPQVSTSVAQQMAHHWALVQDAQTRTNLTGKLDTEHAIWSHYQDALVALSLVDEAIGQNGEILDVGSGAGFPGIVLALARPEARIVLLEPRRLRADFLHHAKEQLSLVNVQVVQASLKSRCDPRYQLVLMRAVMGEDAALAAAAPCMAPQGALAVFRRGAPPEQAEHPPLRRQSARAYALGPYGRDRRLDVWILPTHRAYGNDH